MDYNPIKNCPKCHGALFYAEDPMVPSYKKMIKCYQCGSIFFEAGTKNIDGCIVILVRPITPLNRDEQDEKNDKKYVGPTILVP